MFELPPSLLLHQLITHSPTPHTDVVRSYPLMRVTNSSLPFPMNGFSSPPPGQSPFSAHGMPEPMLSTPQSSSVSIQHSHARHSSDWLQQYIEPDMAVSSEAVASSELEQEETLFPPGLASLSPPSTHNRPHSAPPLLPSSLVLPENITNGIATSPPPWSEVVRAMSSDILASVDNADDMKKTAIPHPAIGSISPPVAWVTDASPGFVPPLRPALGNILLSSCPGKKGDGVVLSAP